MKDIYQLADEDVLYTSDVQDRIDELQEAQKFGLLTPQEAQKFGLLTPHEEIAALKTFLEDMGDAIDGAVRHTYFATYAYEESKDIYGADAVDSDYWDSDKFEDNLATDQREVTLLNVTFYVNR